MGKIKAGVFNPFPVAPIALVGANVGGKANYMAVAFVNGVNVNPPTIYVSLNKNHMTPQGIIENGTFSINFPSAAHVVETDYCGLVSGREVDKSEIFTSFYGELETAPMIEEFPISCECRYTGRSVEFAMDVVYFGEVVQAYIDESLSGADKKIDLLKADPICFCGLDNRYYSLGQVIGQGWSIGRQYRKK
jgi:flavin reductase (DIM6/NTAB) family NADH-FMN oxidoreductase RutF